MARTVATVMPWESKIAMSPLFSDTTITRADTILNAATAIISSSIKNIMFFSIFTASNNGPWRERQLLVE